MPILPALCRCATAVVAAFVLAIASRVARADCIDDAAARHQVNAYVLRAIGWQESRLQPAAVGRNANGSVDLGAFQINSIHLPELGRYGLDRAALADGCVSAEVAAWHYRRQVDLQGDNWQAVGAYHSHTSTRAAWYANQIATILMRWHVMPPGALPFALVRPPAPARPRPSAPTASPLLAVMPAPPSDGNLHTFGELAYLPTAR